MTDDDLLALLRTKADRVTRAEAEAVVARGEALVPKLAAIIADPEAWDAEGDAWWAPIHATFLLAAIGGPAVVAPLIEALQRSNEDDVDWVHDGLPDLLGRIGGPAVDALRAVALDERELDFTRVGALEGLAAIAAQHPAERDRVADALHAIAAAATDEEVRWSAGRSLLDLARPGDRDLLEKLVREQKQAGVPVDWFPREVATDAEAGRSSPPSAPEDPLSFYDPAAIEARQARWAEEAKLAENLPDNDLDDEEDEDDEDEEGSDAWQDAIADELSDGSPELPAGEEEDDGDGGEDVFHPPAINTQAAPGRNDPCPCGSGRKYKKCCGAPARG